MDEILRSHAFENSVRANESFLRVQTRTAKFSSAVLCSVRRKRKLFYHHWAAHSFPPKINFPSDGSGSFFTTIGRLIVFRRDAKPMNLTSHPPAIFFQSRKCMHASLASRPKKMHANPLGPSLALASYKANKPFFLDSSLLQMSFDFVSIFNSKKRTSTDGRMNHFCESEIFYFVTTGATAGKFLSGGFMFRPTEAEVVLQPLGGS